MITVLAGLFCLFIATGLILPALAKVRNEGAMPLEVVGFYTLGIVLMLVGMGTVALSFKKRKAV